MLPPSRTSILIDPLIVVWMPRWSKLSHKR
jgi:hypothetical protein